MPRKEGLNFHYSYCMLTSMPEILFYYFCHGIHHNKLICCYAPLLKLIYHYPVFHMLTLIWDSSFFYYRLYSWIYYLQLCNEFWNITVIAVGRKGIPKHADCPSRLRHCTPGEFGVSGTSRV